MVTLNTSEIVLEDTYTDRLNNNKPTQTDNTNIFSYSFTFQAAVQRLEDRNTVDLRIILIPDRGGQDTYGTSEENCMCNTGTLVTGLTISQSLLIRLDTPWVWSCILISSTQATLRIYSSCGLVSHSTHISRRRMHNNSCFKNANIFPKDFFH